MHRFEIARDAFLRDVVADPIPIAPGLGRIRRVEKPALKRVGRVEIPQEAFLAVLKMDSE